jgi:pyruvate formate-lyase/glycerol dehydratase family glycyl radical enzyme
MPEAKLIPSKRVQQILDHRRDQYDRQEISVRDRVYRRVFAENPGEFQAVRFAKSFAAFLQEKRILIRKYDLLAGYAYRYTYQATMPLDMPLDFDPEQRPPSFNQPYREAEDCVAWHGYPTDSPEAKELNTFAQGISCWLYKHWESGHIIPGVQRLFNLGFGGLLKIGQDSLTKEQDPERRKFLEAMLICAQASINYVKRYQELASAMAVEEENLSCRSQLEKMAAALRQIASGPPQSFDEAIQLVWLMLELIYCETFPASVSLGRLDKYLYPFYAADLAQGKISRDEAADLIDALWIKLSAMRHSYQNITIGGLSEDGGFLANEITYMILQSSRKLRFDQPLISLRYDFGIPDSLWREAVELLKTGTGFPAFFYDGTCVAAKLRTGDLSEDAHEYGLIGCVEMGTPGREYSKTEVLRVNWPLVMELMLNGGKHNLGDETFPLFCPRKLEDIRSFEEFYRWYQNELAEFTRLALRCVNRLDEALPYCYPTPYMSLLMEGCLEKGLDVTAGGTIYNHSGANACGMANVADSLAAIEKLVFQDKKLTLMEFAEVLRQNYQNTEWLYREVTGNCPKYGNDGSSPDSYLAELVEMIAKVLDEFTTPRGGRFRLGLYTVEDHAKMGVRTGALPDGKLKGASLSNGLSPVQGKDVNGPTAVINSLLKIDLSAATNGMVLDLKFTPAFFDNERHVTALRALIDTYFRRGGMEIQFNVVDRATLTDAQKHPEKHQDLVVRVSGFSAYFSSLIKATQDEIIARTEYSAMG